MAIDTFAKEVESAHQRPLQGPDLLLGFARRRARVGRGGAARHARPDVHVDRPGAELRARRRDPRHPVPVPRLRPRALRCSTARSARSCCRSSRPRASSALAWGENGFRHMTNSKRPVTCPGRPQGPEDADDGESGAHPGVQGVRDHPDADGVHRGVHRAAAGHRRRPGEPAVGHHRGQARPGAEVPVAHRPRLFAGADPDEQGAVRQAVAPPTGRRSSTPRRRRSRPTAPASTKTRRRRSPTCAARA